MCVLNDLGVGHHFECAIPFRREPLWGPKVKDDEDVADEWWQADITKLNYSCLSEETRKAFQLARHHCPQTFESDPVTINPGVAEQRLKAEGVECTD